MMLWNHTEIKSKLFNILEKIAPEIDPNTVDLDANISYEFEIDSMDFLRMMVEIKEVFDIDIPESDYGKITSLHKLVDYLQRLI